jgi:AraC family transcriptional regulator
MNPVGKALWYIESHFANGLSLDDVSAASGVTRHHLVRAFGYATGHSVMRYVRGRRLSEAAKALAGGAPDILAVAIDAGYGSHEAFTRAFVDQFGITPGAVRARRHVTDLKLMEPIRMEETLLKNLEPPRIESGRVMLIAGLSERYTNETCPAMPGQWQRFGPHIGHIPGQVGAAAYGVVCNSDGEGNVDYITGVELADFSDVPPEFGRIRLARQTYAVFTHRDHISAIRRTWHTIFVKGLPASGHRIADAPEFERYGEAFDPHTGMGGLEIWIPIRE